MSKIKNWILPLLIAISAFLIEYFSLIQEAIVAFGLQPKWVIIVKLGIGFIGIIILKLQHPSLAKAKIARAKLAKKKLKVATE